MKATQAAKRSVELWAWLGWPPCDLLALSQATAEDDIASEHAGRFATPTFAECAVSGMQYESQQGWETYEIAWDLSRVPCHVVIEMLTCLEGVAQYGRRHFNPPFLWSINIAHRSFKLYLESRALQYMSLRRWWQQFKTFCLNNLDQYFCSKRWRQNLVSNTLIALGTTEDPGVAHGVGCVNTLLPYRTSSHKCHTLLKTRHPVCALALWIETCYHLKNALSVELDGVHFDPTDSSFAICIELRSKTKLPRDQTWLEGCGSLIRSAHSTWVTLRQLPVQNPALYRRRCVQASFWVAKAMVVSRQHWIRKGPEWLVKNWGEAEGNRLGGESFGPLAGDSLVLPLNLEPCARLPPASWNDAFREHVKATAVVVHQGTTWLMYVPLDKALVVKLSAVGVVCLMDHAMHQALTHAPPIRCTASGTWLKFSCPQAKSEADLLAATHQWLATGSWADTWPMSESWSPHLLAGLSVLLGFPLDRPASTILAGGNGNGDLETMLEGIHPGKVCIRTRSPILILALYTRWLQLEGLSGTASQFQREGLEFTFVLQGDRTHEFEDFVAERGVSKAFWEANRSAMQLEVANCLNAFCSVKIRGLGATAAKPSLNK